MRWLERWLTGYEPRAALAQELGPMPSTHKMAHNLPYLQFRGGSSALFWPPWVLHACSI
jgi:hypothetical protein